MAASSSLACSIRGCVNEFGVTDSSHLLYVCTLDDIQCKSWLGVIPKASLKPLHDKLCVCSLHFAGGSGAATDALPTIFPPVPGSSEEMITDEPTVPGPAIKIKEEPIDDYELSASGMESSECTRSPTGLKEEDDESSMEVTQGTSAGPSRSRRLIPASRVKKEVEDLTNGATSSSAADDDSSSLGGGGFLRLESCSYPVKQEPLENGDEDEDEDDEDEEEEEEEEEGEEDEDENSEDVDDVDGESTVDGMIDDDAEIATPAPGSGCGVDPGPCVASSSSSAYLPPAVVKMEEFGECPAEDYEIENLVPSALGVKVKTEPPDETDAEPSSADQGCQANDGTSVALMPPGFISEDAVPSSSVAVGSSMLTVGNGVLAGDTGFVISNAFSSATGAGVVDEAAAARKHQATTTGRSTRTVWTQTFEPEKRTVWTQVAQLGDLKMLYHRSTQTDPWLERSPRLPRNTRRKRTYDEIAGPSTSGKK